MDNLSKSVAINYVNFALWIVEIPLWITPVDKPVEIVEKFRFSTGISLV
jgi:hypothetical protein